MLSHGHPLVQLTPLAERELKINLIEDNTFFTRLQERSSLITFNNAHKKRKDILENDCPFKHGDKND